MKETIDSLKLTFETENEKDRAFIIESFVLLAGTMLALQQLLDLSQKIGEMIEAGAEEAEVAPLFHRVVGAQEALSSSTKIFRGMLAERNGEKDLSSLRAGDLHNAPGVVQ